MLVEADIYREISFDNIIWYLWHKRIKYYCSLFYCCFLIPIHDNKCFEEVKNTFVFRYIMSALTVLHLPIFTSFPVWCYRVKLARIILLIIKTTWMLFNCCKTNFNLTFILCIFHIILPWSCTYTNWILSITQVVILKFVCVIYHFDKSIQRVYTKVRWLLF